MFDNELVMTNLGPASELMALLDVQLDECTPTRVSASIAADERHHQPWGIVHGGLYTTAIETFATVGAHDAVKDRGQQTVGVANATDFLRPHEAGASRSSPSPSTKAASSSSGRSTSAAPTTTSSSRAAKCVCRTWRRDHERLRDDG